jgi:hypothetical protein
MRTRWNMLSQFRDIIESDFPELMSMSQFEDHIRLDAPLPTAMGPPAELAGSPEPQQFDPSHPGDGESPPDVMEEWLRQTWRKEIVAGYDSLRVGKYGNALHHFEAAERIRRYSYESSVGLLHANLGLLHMHRAAVCLRRLTRLSPDHFASSFKPEELYDPPQLYLTQVRIFRDKISEGNVEASCASAYAYVTWFGGNRPVALQVAKQPGVRNLIPNLWRIMEATVNGQLVRQPRITVPIPGLPGIDEDGTPASTDPAP